MGQSVRERKGTLGGKDIFLSRTAEQPYALIYREIQPDRVDIPGASGKIEGDPSIRSWIMTDWSGGEGEPLWQESLASYNTNAGLRPGYDGKGLILSPTVDNPQTDAPAAMAASGVFTYRAGTVYTARDATRDGYEWDNTNEQWDVKTGLTAAGSGNFQSMAVGASSIIFLSTDGTPAIHKWSPGSSVTVHYASWGGTAILGSIGDIIYCTKGSDLYSVDQAVATTRTLVVDNSNTGTGPSINGLVVDDVGVQWLVLTTHGDLVVHHYNHFTDSHSVIGQLPDKGLAAASALYFGKGFTWVLAAKGLSATEDGLLWFKAGGQEGTVSIPGSSTASGARLDILGFIDDNLYFNLNGNVWTYNISTGGIYHITKSSSDEFIAEQGFVIHDQLFFGGGVGGSGVSTRFQLNSLDLATGSYNTLNTGRFDFDYPGFAKIFREVIVYTDTGDGDDGSLQLAYAVDGGSFTTHADTKTISAANRKHTFTLSSSAASVAGTELELQLRMKSDGTDAPIIRKVVARAVPSAKTVEYALELDVAGPHADGTQPSSTQMLSFLKTVATTGTVLAFVNPWEVEDHEAAETIDVEVVQVILPEAGAEAMEQGTAKIRLRATSTA